jgi:hypothetical protein
LKFQNKLFTLTVKYLKGNRGVEMERPLSSSLLLSLLVLFATNLAYAHDKVREVSPYKGPADATVEIAVFTRFQ